MAACHHFLLSSLPHLGEITDAPPVTTADMLRHVEGSGGPTAIIETILLADDLIQRDALQAGEVDQADPAVLTNEQIRGDDPMPASLAPQEQPPGRIAADAVWAAYFTHAAETARAGTFLAAWVAWEVALRNALAESRAKTLDLEVEAYLVVPQIGDADADFADLLTEVSAAGDPLAAMQAVDRARWAWLDEHEAWFSFGNDELAVYAARLMLMVRWQRLAKAQAEKEKAPPAG